MGLRLQIFSCKDHVDFFWYELQKNVLMRFSAVVGRHFLNQTALGAIFARIFRDIAQIFDRSKIFGSALHPLHSRLLHHWLVFICKLFQGSLQVAQFKSHGVCPGVIMSRRLRYLLHICSRLLGRNIAQ